MAKHRDLQPWIEYFGMLRSYEEKGFLEVIPEKHEAFITRAALCTLCIKNVLSLDSLATKTLRIVKSIYAYAGWKCQQGGDYLSRPFALHVVKEDAPHDLLYTVLLAHRRHWWWPLRKTEHIEVITYDTKAEL